MHDIDLEVLMDYADELGDEGRVAKREVVQECLRRMHDAYKWAQERKTEIDGFVPRSEFERLAMKMYGMRAYGYKDKVWFEVGTVGNQKRFDNAIEVLDWMVSRWNLEIGTILKSTITSVTRTISELEHLSEEDKQSVINAVFECKSALDDRFRNRVYKVVEE